MVIKRYKHTHTHSLLIAWLLVWLISHSIIIRSSSACLPTLRYRREKNGQAGRCAAVWMQIPFVWLGRLCTVFWGEFPERWRSLRPWLWVCEYVCVCMYYIHTSMLHMQHLHKKTGQLYSPKPLSYNKVGSSYTVETCIHGQRIPLLVHSRARYPINIREHPYTL